jgi:hypothetical protein
MAGTKPARPGPGPSELGEALADILANAPDDVVVDLVGQLTVLRETINDALGKAVRGWDETAHAYLTASGALHAVLDATRPVANRPPNPAARSTAPAPGPGVDQGPAPNRRQEEERKTKPGAGPAGPAAVAAGPAPVAWQHHRTDDLPLAIDDALRRVWADLESNSRAGDYARACVRSGLPQDPAERARKRWEWLHLLCLRLPGQEARTWRDEAATAVAAACTRRPPGLAGAGSAPVPSSPGEAAQPEVPGLPEIDYPGSGFLHERKLPPGLADVADRLEPRSAGLCAFTAAALWLYEHDPLLSEHQRTRWDPDLYQTDIRYSIDNLVHAQQKRDEWNELTRLIGLDQKLRSVYPVPFPYPESWWDDHLGRLAVSLATHPYAERIEPPAKLIKRPFRTLLDKGQVDPASEQASPDIAGRAVAAGNVAWLLRLGYTAKEGAPALPLVVFVSQNS